MFRTLLCPLQRLVTIPHIRVNSTNSFRRSGLYPFYVPLMQLMCVDSQVPMLIRRKEAKEYGTKKMIEGNYEKGAEVLLVVLNAAYCCSLT